MTRTAQEQYDRDTLITRIMIAVIGVMFGACLVFAGLVQTYRLDMTPSYTNLRINAEFVLIERDSLPSEAKNWFGEPSGTILIEKVPFKGYRRVLQIPDKKFAEQIKKAGNPSVFFGDMLWVTREATLLPSGFNESTLIGVDYRIGNGPVQNRKDVHLWTSIPVDSDTRRT